jgi:hypothetical protein
LFERRRRAWPQREQSSRLFVGVADRQARGVRTADQYSRLRARECVRLKIGGLLANLRRAFQLPPLLRNPLTCNTMRPLCVDGMLPYYTTGTA